MQSAAKEKFFQSYKLGGYCTVQWLFQCNIGVILHISDEWSCFEVTEDWADSSKEEGRRVN